MKISFLLDSIDSGTVVLPEFQRGYVWTRDQVKGLIQSLYQRYPVGSLLIWNTKAGVTDLRGDVAAGADDNVKLLLDGQQRITSLYGVVRSKPPRFFEDPEKEKSFKNLFFHLDTEAFEFYAPTKMGDDPLWISVSDLMVNGFESVTEPLAEDDTISKKAYNQYVNRVQRLYGIRDIELHDENISGEDKTVDVVVDIFNRVNSGGTKLSKGDLALARICAVRPESREELRETIAKWKNAGFDLAMDWFLRCINVVATGEAKFSAMKDMSAEDFGVALKKAEQAVDFIFNLLSSRLGIDHDRVLLGRYGIPALVRHVVDRGGSVTDATEQDRMLFWFLHQGMWGRYSGSTESILDRDLEALDEGGLDGLIGELERWRGSLIVRPADFDTATIGSRFYPILYVLTRVHDAKDLCSGIKLSQHLLGKGSHLEVHHIFPKSRLHKEGYSRKEVNAVANFAFLTGDCNKAISNQHPTAYLPDVAAQQPGAVESQWITTDQSLWVYPSYPDFLADRRQRLADATNALLDDLSQGAFAVTVEGRSSGAEEDDELSVLSDWCSDLGLARPMVPGEIIDEETGEALVYPDAAWTDGVQPGLGQPIALVLDHDEETEARLGELGYRFFTTIESFKQYVEELLNLDLDGDGVVGVPDDRPSKSDVAGDPSSSGHWRDRVVDGSNRDRVVRLLKHAESLGCIVRIPNGRRTDYLNVRPPSTSTARGRVFSIHVRTGSVEFQDESWSRLGAPAGFRRLDAGNKAARSLDSEDDYEELVRALERELGDSSTSTSTSEAEDSNAYDEDEFQRAMVQVYERAKSEAGYNASYFIQMVSELGGLAAAKQLVTSSAPSQGFTSLWEAGRLDLSVEALVLQPEWRGLFSRVELRTAERRLRDHGYGE